MRGRITQSANSPTNAPAAAMASILNTLQLCSLESIVPSCYGPFTQMLKICCMRKENPTLLPQLRRGVRCSVVPVPTEDTPSIYSLLLAEENPGKNDPEGEESCESSGGGDGYHWLASSEIVVTIVSGQVVTSRLRRCKIFVTCKFPSPLTPPSGIALSPIRNRVAPCRERQPAWGDRRYASIPPEISSGGRKPTCRCAGRNSSARPPTG